MPIPLTTFDKIPKQDHSIELSDQLAQLIQQGRQKHVIVEAIC